MGEIVEFPMLELKAAWKEASQRLKTAGISMPLLDSRLLLQHVLQFTYEDLLANPRRKLKQNEIEAYAKLLARRLKREPVSVILGVKPFWKHTFRTSIDTLDPRPDSETLVDLVVKRFSNKSAPLHILDLGTGTGVLLLSLLDEFPNASGVGVDISEKALEIAKENAKKLDVESRVELTHSDWFENVKGRFDIILSNPPYIATDAIEHLEPEVVQYDPHLALDGGKDGLDAYRLLAQQLGEYLAEDGIILLEIGQGQEDAVEDIMQDAGLEVAIKERDLSGIIRCLMVVKPKA